MPSARSPAPERHQPGPHAARPHRHRLRREGPAAPQPPRRVDARRRRQHHRGGRERLLPGRGYKEDNKYAVSYTDYCEHRITRGNGNPNDDFVIRPGQSWCVIRPRRSRAIRTSPSTPPASTIGTGAGLRHLPLGGCRLEFPAAGHRRPGTEHVFTTPGLPPHRPQPLAGYRVRYHLLTTIRPACSCCRRGPRSGRRQRPDGNASAIAVQLRPHAGVNRIGIEIIRPPDPTAPSGAASCWPRARPASSGWPLSWP